MASVFILPTAGISPIATSYQRQNALISKLMAGHAGLSLSNMNSAGVPQVRAGSVFEVSNRMFFVPAGADEEISGSPVMGQNYIYAVTNPNGATFKYSATKPVWNTAKGGWYSGADRAVAKFVYSGGQYKQKKILGKRRSGEYTSVQNPGDVVEFYQGGLMRAQLKMALAGLVMSGMLTACDGVMSKGDIKAQVLVDSNWTAGTLPAGTWSSVTYAAGKFVAVGYTNFPTAGLCAYSADGINWTAGTLPAGTWNSVTYAAEKFVAVGWIWGSLPSPVGKIAYSTDGINWTAVDLPNIRLECVTYGAGKFVALGRDGKVEYSTDGINWTEGTIPNATWYSITYANGKFVAVGYDGVFAYSTDGLNWTNGSMPNGRLWYDVTYAAGKFVAVGYTTSPIAGLCAYSADGINWTKGSIPTASWNSVTYAAEKFVAVGSYGTAGTAGKVAYSTDGINWTAVDLPTVGGNSVTYEDGKFVMVGEASTSYIYASEVKLVYNADGSVGWKKA